ncbi:cell division protein ZapE [Oharaeibacter diazotrophicus]|uniref:Cell division protein ZapE n=1 Tax=Oharaeibacter diazotrophicus TaxID=1920512 RepID=A0A4R6R7N2_9HYPH|nr:cell division protein ZapE [Oharaeibacter diazotrophicus]TDP81983.1 cell division protein ZapE [Oharaeibacter diazotrophicus]BBE73615.1 AFG1-like ATPase [Pleomorphomonas sp. SM30]GLS75404.1 cell division protein ZapE [Oharaeibacter diazotrophicus]
MTSHPHPSAPADYGADRPTGACVTAAYDRLAAAGEITADPAQRAVAAALDRLLRDLGERKLAAKGSALGWLFGRGRRTANGPGPRGLYVWGGVGRGKTMLMDLFFGLVPVETKIRRHFHVFMADVHARVHAARRAIAAGAERDPVAAVADAIAAETTLICFDEFAVTDIGDAMILGRLFTRLFDLGVTLVATSNVEPGRLYEDGINRDHFLPFVGLLQRRCEVLHLGSPNDYRLRTLARADVWFSPLGRDTDVAVERLWTRLTGAERGAPRALAVAGRTVTVPESSGPYARFAFADLCGKPLGAADYRAVAAAFDTVFVERVPVLDHARRNEAKRFITLVDTLYDEGIKLVASAAAEPTALYVATHGTEAFEFDRTASRLIEMRSEAYLAAPRRDGAAADAETGSPA